MATIAVLGTMDTKGLEHQYLADRIRQRGHVALLIDVGSGPEPTVAVDIDRFQVAGTAGVDIRSLSNRGDRGQCVTAMSAAAEQLLLQLHTEQRIDGVISLGGGGGTAIATAAMRSLPIGFPKLMVSTLASGNTQHYVGTKDIVMMPSIVDVAGLNRVSKLVFTRAAGAICGMVEANVDCDDHRPLIVASMFGNTTQCVQQAIPVLESAGYEVLIFHATGTGGRAMESLINSRLVDGVLDITTTEWADELVGGVLSAGPERLGAAAKSGVPAIVVPGCLDMVNFGAIDSVPEQFQHRELYQHNPQVTLMRTTPDECTELGRIIAEKVNASTTAVSVLLPLRGVSALSIAGQPFHDPRADAALFDSLRNNLRADIPVHELDQAINSPEFSQRCAQELLKNIASRATKSRAE